MRGQHCSGQQGGAEAIGAESGSCRRAALSQQGISLDTAFGDTDKDNSFFHACQWEVWAALIGKEKFPQSTQGFPLFHGSDCSAAFLPLCKQPHSSSSHIPALCTTPGTKVWTLLPPYYHFTTPLLLQHWDCPAAQPTADFLTVGVTATGTAAVQENTAWWGDGTQGTLASKLTKQSLIGYQEVHQYCL